MKAKKCHAFFVCMSEMVGAHKQITTQNINRWPMGYNRQPIKYEEIFDHYCWFYVVFMDDVMLFNSTGAFVKPRIEGTIYW